MYAKLSDMQANGLSLHSSVTVRKADVCQINPKQALPVVYYDRFITLLFTCGTLFLLYICHIAVFYVCLYVLGKHLKLLWSKEEITVHNSTIIVCILI